MSKSRIGVGIIGVQPGRSFAAVAHIPALKALPQYDIAAISTTRLESAQAAAKEYGISKAYGNHVELVNDPNVDLVVVTVKVPYHRELVTAALQAGKAVYCEWPLGNGLAEAQKMADLARSRKIHTAIGLQARAAPAVNYVRDLVAQGYVGEVLSTTLIGTGMNWGPYVDAPNAYTFDARNGATMLTIPIGHTLDALCYALGEVREVSATLAQRRISGIQVETGATVPLTAKDQVAVTGLLQSGAVLTMHYRGGMSRGTGLLWEINGSEGDLQISSIGGHAQLFDLAVRGGKGQEQATHSLEIPDKYRWAPASATGFALNVAQAYMRLADDMRDGTHTCPNFDDAVTRHKLLAAIEAAADSGRRTAIV